MLDFIQYFDHHFLNMSRRYMAGILPIRHKTKNNESINLVHGPLESITLVRFVILTNYGNIFG